MGVFERDDVTFDEFTRDLPELIKLAFRLYTAYGGVLRQSLRFQSKSRQAVMRIRVDSITSEPDNAASSSVYGVLPACIRVKVESIVDVEFTNCAGELTASALFMYTVSCRDGYVTCELFDVEISL